MLKLHFFFCFISTSFFPCGLILKSTVSALGPTFGCGASTEALGFYVAVADYCPTLEFVTGFFLDSWYSLYVPNSSTFFLFRSDLLGFEDALRSARVLPLRSEI